MSDMASTIVPKSDQLNADDLIAGTKTITITGVKIKSGEQPISIHYEGDNGKPYKACKSMCRVMVTAWGPDSKAYVGRSMTLYRDPSVTWAGMAVGGIRISHMSDIDSKITMALTATKQSRKPYTVQPLKVASGATKQPAAAQVPEGASQGAEVPATVSSAKPPALAADPTRDPDEFDPLLIKGREWAELGIEKYADWWQNKLSKADRAHIGTERHDKFKAIAAGVTA